MVSWETNNDIDVVLVVMYSRISLVGIVNDENSSGKTIPYANKRMLNWQNNMVVVHVPSNLIWMPMIHDMSSRWIPFTSHHHQFPTPPLFSSWTPPTSVVILVWSYFDQIPQNPYSVPWSFIMKRWISTKRWSKRLNQLVGTYELSYVMVSDDSWDDALILMAPLFLLRCANFIK